MRGEDIGLDTVRVFPAWITPACAGKTLVQEMRPLGRADHPRMRGEDAGLIAERDRNVGSPPHARGRRRESNRDSKSGRITPACAGKTTTAVTRPPCAADHPRMRGEDLKGSINNVDIEGSPPHARGRLQPACNRRRRLRITPACAGKTILRKT